MAAKIIQKKFHMDNFAKSVRTEEELSRLEKDIEAGGISSLKWICINEIVCNSKPGKYKSDAVKKTFEAEPHTFSLLGLQLNVEADEL